MLNINVYYCTLECDLWNLCFMLTIFLFAACLVRCSVYWSLWRRVCSDRLLVVVCLVIHSLQVSSFGYVWCGRLRYCADLRHIPTCNNIRKGLPKANQEFNQTLGWQKL
jgi:hypothetical protein